MSGYGDSWGSGRRDQADWQNQMQGGTQPDINADEGMGSDPMSGDTSQMYSSGYDQGMDQPQGNMSQGGMSGMGAQGQGWAGGYGGQATQAYPQAGSTQGMYGQGGGSGGMQSSGMQGGQPGDEGLSGQHSTQGLREQQQQAEGQRKSGGILGGISSIGEKAQRAAERKLQGE